MPAAAFETPTTPDADAADLFERMKRSGITVNSFVLVAALRDVSVGRGGVSEATEGEVGTGEARVSDMWWAPIRQGSQRQRRGR
ncbi:hypothetical protein QJS10_CPA06g00162 [Acorus calamus]|uniref:Uncharacterized protein n=1 Tax=Acorus calamus TaxID=4465 RepID=A0AAV9ENY1_ACOCL|nr:hypothetical protein QJS10_CPA06g00162 [Acorus calamus]